MYIAFYIGSDRLVKYLIEGTSKIDVNATDHLGQTPVLVALGCKFDKIVEYLLSKAAHIDFSTRERHALLLFAAQMDYKKKVQRIVGEISNANGAGTLLQVVGLIFMLIYEFLRTIFEAPRLRTEMPEPDFTDIDKAGGNDKHLLDPALGIYTELLCYASRGDHETIRDLLVQRDSSHSPAIDLALIKTVGEKPRTIRSMSWSFDDSDSD